ncbi:MAG TPA: nucleic acid-binding protein [Firmicutes bacterium]|nr:nucleic acid-binding protein [Bacillota bacterium]
MRKCIKCNGKMIEDLDVKVEGGAYGLKVTQQGVFKENLGKFKCAVCPECGYIETYMQDTTKIKKLALNKNQK